VGLCSSTLVVVWQGRRELINLGGGGGDLDILTNFTNV
jgi:hypothetical protein